MIPQNRYVICSSGRCIGFLTTPNSGRVLGGSSAINFEIFNRPASIEYSAWSALNLGTGQGWNWDGLLPYFKKTETYTPPLREDTFPDPTPTRRRRDEEEVAGTDIPTDFLASAVSALNATALDVSALLAAAGVADTLSAGESTDVTKRSLLAARADAVYGSSGPVKASHNTWYSDVASPYIHAMQNLGISINSSPVRPFEPFMELHH